MEEMRQRFLKCGIAVNEPELQECDGGLIICPNSSFFDCRAAVHYPGITRYTLSLRLISNDPHRVISAFRITSVWEKEIRVLGPFERVPEKYVDWDPEENILNNRIGQAVGATRCREGLLLAEGLRSPATNGGSRSASVTIWVYDQFDQVYSHIVDVDVIGLDDLMIQREKPGKVRESVFAPTDVPKAEILSRLSIPIVTMSNEWQMEEKADPLNPKRKPVLRKNDGPEKRG